MYDIIVVGAGPAGLTAALYARRANKSVLVLDAKGYGGQIINTYMIENYPGIANISGFDYATNLYNQVKDMGVVIKTETVVRVEEDKTVVTNKNKYNGKAVILATGVENRKLKVDGESEFTGKGVSYCATCDGNFYKNKVVAVIGGGNTAMEEALYLSDIAKEVYLICRSDKFHGEERYLDELKKKDNVKLIMNSNVVKINGDKVLESIDVKDNDDNIQNILVNGLFIAVGQEPKNEIFTNVVEINDYGYFVSEDGVHTKTSGIYIAGDAREKDLRQLTTAVADGSIAATIAVKEMK